MGFLDGGGAAVAVTKGESDALRKLDAKSTQEQRDSSNQGQSADPEQEQGITQGTISPDPTPSTPLLGSHAENVAASRDSGGPTR